MTKIFAALFLIFFLTLESLQVRAQINVEYYMNKGIGEYNRNDYTLAIQTFNALPSWWPPADSTAAKAGNRAAARIPFSKPR